MGLNLKYLNQINEHVNKIYSSTKNLTMLELGNQVINQSAGPITEKTGKEYFTKLGYIHTSIDLNGLDGAEVKDLSKLGDFNEFKEKFDVVTNMGTIEHVEPFESQYTAFLNAHNSLKIGGVIIHQAPEIKVSKKGHAQYYYDLDFWDTIVEHSDCIFLGTTIVNKWRQYAYQKTGNAFIDKNLLLSKIYKVRGPVGGMYKTAKDKKSRNNTIGENK